MIKKEEIKSPQLVGPNEVLSENVKNTTVSILSSPASSNKAKNDIAENKLWRIMGASYQLLNKTDSNFTRHCWLCFSIRPPYCDAIGDLGEPTYTNTSNPTQCDWEKDVGVTLTQVTGRGWCVGTVPSEKSHLCNITKSEKQSAEWLIPANNTRWVCSSVGVTPCLSLKLFNASHDFCVQVIIILRILYHSEEYAYTQHIVPDHHLNKREPFTTVTLATLMFLETVGAGTGVASGFAG